MAAGAKIKVQGRWQGGMKFQFHDGFGHSLTIDAPPATAQVGLVRQGRSRQTHRCRGGKGLRVAVAGDDGD